MDFDDQLWTLLQGLWATLCLTFLLCAKVYGQAVTYASPNPSFPSYIFTQGGTAGSLFRANTTMSVTALGMQGDGGRGLGVLSDSHEVGLWTASGLLLAQASFAAGSQSSPDGFDWASLTSPVRLEAGSSYILGESFPDDVDADGDPLASRAAIDPSFTYLGSRFITTSGGLTFPTGVYPGLDIGWFGPNLQAQVVPEPSALALIVVGAFVLCSLRLSGHF
jgi:uncharacterized protein DUF4082